MYGKDEKEIILVEYNVRKFKRQTPTNIKGQKRKKEEEENTHFMYYHRNPTMFKEH